MMKHGLKTLAMAISLSGMVSTSAFSNTEVPHELQVTVSEQAYAVSYTAAELGLETSYQIVIEVIGASHERIGLIELENPLYTQFEEFDEQTGEFISTQAQWFERGILTLSAAQQAILNQGESFRAYTLDENGSVVELMLSGHKSMSLPMVRSAMTSAYKLIDNGSPQDKIDLVLLGDGYRADEKEKFRQDAASVMDGFFSKTPYSDYRDYFNVWLIEKPSQTSGVAENGHPFEGSAFRSYFPDSSSRLLILKDRFQSINEANSVLPNDADEIYLVVANTDKYGGVGYQNIATMSTHYSAVSLALHEVGHTFGKLADEYSYGTCYLNREPNAKNVTMKSSDVKWSHWIGHDPDVGIFEGADYCSEGKYRPTKNSLMRSLGSSRQFEAVNTEALILKMYETIKPLASVSPTEQSITLQGMQSFSVTTPIPLNRLEITWLLNGKVVNSGQNTQLTLDAEQLESGSHTLKAIVRDTTNQVKSDPSGRLANERQWQLNVADQTPDETGEGFRYVRLVADSEI
ncbi:fibronectin, partial [Vibrio xuii]